MKALWIFQSIFWLTSSTYISDSGQTKMAIRNRENTKDLVTDPWKDIANETLCSSDGDPEAILEALTDLAYAESAPNVQIFVIVGKNDGDNFNFAFSMDGSDGMGRSFAMSECGYNMVVYRHNAQPGDENCSDKMKKQAQQLIDVAAAQENSNIDVLRRIGADEQSFQVAHFFTVAYDIDNYEYADSLYKDCNVEKRRVFRCDSISRFGVWK